LRMTETFPQLNKTNKALISLKGVTAVCARKSKRDFATKRKAADRGLTAHSPRKNQSL
jgi:hypothetical protein